MKRIHWLDCLYSTAFSILRSVHLHCGTLAGIAPDTAGLRALLTLQGVFDDVPGITEELFDALTELRAWAAYFSADR